MTFSGEPKRYENLGLNNDKLMTKLPWSVLAGLFFRSVIGQSGDMTFGTKRDTFKYRLKKGLRPGRPSLISGRAQRGRRTAFPSALGKLKECNKKSIGTSKVSFFFYALKVGFKLAKTDF